MNTDKLCIKYYSAKNYGGKFHEITVNGDKKMTGRYILLESGAVTPSHNPFNGFRKSAGYPTDRHGQNVNGSDYERNTIAQDYTREIAANYDERAFETPVVVSLDGVVLSGNMRTMAGEIAARNNTDSAYIEYLKNHASLFGFTPDQVSEFAHPRIVLQLLQELPYNAKTFALFSKIPTPPTTPTPPTPPTTPTPIDKAPIIEDTKKQRDVPFIAELFIMLVVCCIFFVSMANASLLGAGFAIGIGAVASALGYTPVTTAAALG